MFKFRRLLVITVTLVIISAAAYPSAAQIAEGATQIEQVDDALIMDAKAYATAMDVDLDEAISLSIALS